MANMLRVRHRVRNKTGAKPKRNWSPRATLAFCGLVSLALWALLIAAVVLWFRR